MAIERDGEQDQREVKAGIAVTGSLLAVALVLSLVNLLPGRLAGAWQHRQADVYTAFWPQGWSFFAEQPRDGVLVAYRWVPSGPGPSLTFPLGSPENTTGLDRGGYTRLLEIQLVAARIPAVAWRACGGAQAETCLATAPAERPAVRNEVTTPSLCGPVVFVAQRATAALRLAAVEVACG
ncbi:SdpA family antimicrobial peptide system protein [Amycolatopsis sp. NPDC051106]|uniref:SdpA family antimicrobial peptide system protein n=1 Tax=unclassified Amycolatopsis TaxID=2618356 RepID=UPI00341CBEEE